MSYNACGGGSFRFKDLTEDEKQELLDELAKDGYTPDRSPKQFKDLEPWFRAVGAYFRDVFYDQTHYSPNSQYNRKSGHVLDVSFDNNYISEEMNEIMSLLRPFLVDVSLEFTGEDNATWRFDMKNGEIVERSGEISYTPMDTLSEYQRGIVKAALESYRANGAPEKDYAAIDELLGFLKELSA